MECLGFGCVETPKEEGMGTRLAYLNDALQKIIGHYKPDDIAVEELFFAKNVKTAMLVAHARGIIMMRASMHTGRVFEYRPNAIKLAVAMNGKADKKEMMRAVTNLLGFQHAPKLDDTADALAIAICHATTGRGA
jgi:crossover junction endodeoxyribonuclease RuvC